jgi:hypothetical protein
MSEPQDMRVSALEVWRVIGRFPVVPEAFRRCLEDPRMVAYLREKAARAEFDAVETDDV